MNASEILKAALSTLEKRGREYDNTGLKKERSAPKIRDLFEETTGRCLSEREVWVFLQCVKRARLHTTPGHEDSLVDLVAYTALEAEAMSESAKVVEDFRKQIKVGLDNSAPQYEIRAGEKTEACDEELPDSPDQP